MFSGRGNAHSGRIAIGYDNSKKSSNEGDVLKAPELDLEDLMQCGTESSCHTIANVSEWRFVRW